MVSVPLCSLWGKLKLQVAPQAFTECCDSFPDTELHLKSFCPDAGRPDAGTDRGLGCTRNLKRIARPSIRFDLHAMRCYGAPFGPHLNART